MTPEQADRQYKESLNALADKYGGFSFIPSDEWREISEICRAYHIVATNEGSVTKELLSKYMIPASIVTRIVADIVIDDTRRLSRNDQYKVFEKWACEHDREQFTTDQLVEQSGFGYQTTLKFIDGNPHFYRIKKGLYECRNYNADRQMAKKSQ